MPTDTSPLSEIYEAALFGHNPTPRLVALHALTQGAEAEQAVMRLYRRDEAQAGLFTEDAPFYPFFFLSDLQLLRDFPRQRYLCQTLKGANEYRHLVVFNLLPPAFPHRPLRGPRTGKLLRPQRHPSSATCPGGAMPRHALLLRAALAGSRGVLGHPSATRAPRLPAGDAGMPKGRFRGVCFSGAGAQMPFELPIRRSRAMAVTPVRCGNTPQRSINLSARPAQLNAHR